VEIDRGAPAVASSEIEVAAPPEVVWDTLAVRALAAVEYRRPSG
jgi:hypothetical protein